MPTGGRVPMPGALELELEPRVLSLLDTAALGAALRGRLAVAVEARARPAREAVDAADRAECPGAEQRPLAVRDGVNRELTGEHRREPRDERERAGVGRLEHLAHGVLVQHLGELRRCRGPERLDLRE